MARAAVDLVLDDGAAGGGLAPGAGEAVPVGAGGPALLRLRFASAALTLHVRDTRAFLRSVGASQGVSQPALMERGHREGMSEHQASSHGSPTRPPRRSSSYTPTGRPLRTTLLRSRTRPLRQRALPPAHRPPVAAHADGAAARRGAGGQAARGGARRPRAGAAALGGGSAPSAVAAVARRGRWHRGSPAPSRNGSARLGAATRGTVAEVARAVGPSIVEINATSARGQSTGSGVIITDGRRDHHQQPRRRRRGQRQASPSSDGKTYTAKVVGTDRRPGPGADQGCRTPTDLDAGDARRLRQGRGRRPGRRHRLARGPDRHRDQRHRLRADRDVTVRKESERRAARAAGRQGTTVTTGRSSSAAASTTATPASTPPRTRPSRPTPRSTPATPAARSST